ncbi:MAG: ABC transporter substrate-binding protein [Lachnospiraceae bacterium]|nr:ABC transporter substrate-binding protein [Lachnospiraceae bacterium]
MNKRARKWMAAALAGMMLAGTLTGCQSEEQRTEPSQEAGTPESSENPETVANAATSSKDRIVIGVGGTISNLSAKEGVVEQSMNVYSIAGESLLKEVNDENGLPVMTTERSITESYEVDEEKSGIIFHLRDGVAMQDGTTLNADDVVCSVMYMKDGTYYADVDYDNVYAIDESTVFIGVGQVGQPVINKVATIPIFSKEAYEQVNNEGIFFTEGYVSCGQYQITEWVAGDSVTLEAFDSYYNGQPMIKNVVFRIFSESSVAMMELQTGGVDVLMSPDFQSYQDVINGNYGEQFTAEESNGNLLYCVYLNMASEKTQDKRVREAIMYALDRKAISDGAFNGWGSLAYRVLGLTYAGMTDYDESSWPYKQDLEKAKALMAEAGYADGLELNLLTHNAGVYYQNVAEVFANQVKEIGIKVNISVYEPATFKSTQNGLEGWDVSTTSPNTSYITNASDFLNNALIGSMHTDALPAEGYEDALNITTALKSEIDEAKVEELSREFEEHYFNDWLWWYPIQLSGVYTLYDSNLHGFSRCQAVIDLSGAYFE